MILKLDFIQYLIDKVVYTDINDPSSTGKETACQVDTYLPLPKTAHNSFQSSKNLIILKFDSCHKLFH